MIDRNVKGAFDAAFAAPVGRMIEIESAIDALRRYGGQELAGQYDALVAAQPGLAALAEEGARPATDRSGDFEPGTLGSHIADLDSDVSRFYAGQAGKPDESDTGRAVFRYIAAHCEIWRAALAFDTDYEGDLALHAFIAAQIANRAGYVAIASRIGRVAFTDPESEIAVYDALCRGWLAGSDAKPVLDTDWAGLLVRPLDEAVSALGIVARAGEDVLADPLPPSAHRAGNVSPGLAPLLWGVLEDPAKVQDPGQITAAVAGYGKGLDPSHHEASERALLMHAGMPEAVAKPLPPTVKIEDLKGMPEGSLGQKFYSLITDNNFDVEVLDPTALFGAPSLDMRPGEWMNRRILQLHDVFHLVGGYEQTGNDEVAISGFQLAQIGQNYSACFLATAAMISLLYFPAGFKPIFQLTCDGWVHGRKTRPLMPLDWEAMWARQIEDIREEHGIRPFSSRVPNLAEMAAA